MAPRAMCHLFAEFDVDLLLNSMQHAAHDQQTVVAVPTGTRREGRVSEQVFEFQVIPTRDQTIESVTLRRLPPPAAVAAHPSCIRRTHRRAMIAARFCALLWLCCPPRLARNPDFSMHPVRAPLRVATPARRFAPAGPHDLTSSTLFFEPAVAVAGSTLESMRAVPSTKRWCARYRKYPVVAQIGR